MTKSFNTEVSLPPLKKYAFIGNREQFLNKLKYLSRLAENENWHYDSGNPQLSDEEKQFGVLFQYIHHTFAKAEEENNIIESNTHSIMNTGLLTENGEEIYMLFEINQIENQQKWFLTGFFKTSNHQIPQNLRDKFPKFTDYFDNNTEMLYFDLNLEIHPNFDHILNDHLERLPEDIRALDIEIIRTILDSAHAGMKKRILRNRQLVVPQYYNKKIMYLVPLRIGKTDVPAAIEKHENSYRLNTIFTKDMAYCNARLLMKPESNWLINSK